MPSGRRLPGRHAVLRLRLPVPRRERDRTSTGNLLLSPYKIENVRGTKVAFIGATLRGTPLIVTPTGVAGLDFLDALVRYIRDNSPVSPPPLDRLTRTP